MAILPAPFDQMPVDLQETLARSHAEATKGWKGLELDFYLNDLQKCGFLDVIKAVYGRCMKYPRIWTFIDCIIGPWTLEGGHNVSMGFHFRCAKPNDFLNLMRDTAAPFCEDIFNVHGPRDTFREIIKQGPGLHVCITQPAHRHLDLHDIHIDAFQMVCEKMLGGKCNYLNSVTEKTGRANTVGHMKEAIPWMVGDYYKKIKKKISE